MDSLCLLGIAYLVHSKPPILGPWQLPFHWTPVVRGEAFQQGSCSLAGTICLHSFLSMYSIWLCASIIRPSECRRSRRLVQAYLVFVLPYHSKFKQKVNSRLDSWFKSFESRFQFHFWGASSWYSLYYRRIVYAASFDGHLACLCHLCPSITGILWNPSSPWTAVGYWIKPGEVALGGQGATLRLYSQGQFICYSRRAVPSILCHSLELLPHRISPRPICLHKGCLLKTFAFMESAIGYLPKLKAILHGLPG